MNSFIRIFSGILIAIPLFLKGEPIPVATKIEKVTVFLSGAQVNRKGQVTLEAGKQVYIFKGISPKVSPQSIQVKVEGENTLLSVVHQLNHIEEHSKRAEIEVLEKKQTDIIDKIAEEKAMLGVYGQEEGMLSKNQDIKGNESGIKTTELKDALDFHRQRLTEVKLKVMACNKKLKELGEELRKINQQLMALNQQKDLSTSEVLVTVQSSRAQSVGVNLSYLILEARWIPVYDIRVKDIASPLNLAYKANVIQNSGEDWQEVKLTLSSGNPDLGGQKPRIQPWRLGFQSGYDYGYTSPVVNQPAYSGLNTIRQITGRITDKNQQPVIGATVMVVGSNKGAYTDENGYYSIGELGLNDQFVRVEYLGYEPQQLPLQSGLMNVVLNESYKQLNEVAVVTGGKTAEYGDMDRGSRSINAQTVIVDGVKVRGTPELPQQFGRSGVKIDKEILTEFSMTNFQFDIAVPYTIPADGKNYMVEIKIHEIPAFYEYYCAPKLDPDAFLTANIVKWSDYYLIDGETNLFFEGTFVGKGYLNLKESGDTLEISLGRDKSVIVNRTLLKDFSQKQFIGNFKTQNIAYEIGVRNTKKLPLLITLEDQYPISDNKEIVVERLENKEAKVEENTGKITWKLMVENGKERKVAFKYSVKYPKYSNVNVK